MGLCANFNMDDTPCFLNVSINVILNFPIQLNTLHIFPETELVFLDCIFSLYAKAIN